VSSATWIVPTVALRRSLGAQRRERRSGPLGELVVAGTHVPEGAEVAVDVELTGILGGIEAVGTVTAPWQASCRRCLRPVSGTLDIPVRELFCPPLTASSPPAGPRRPGEGRRLRPGNPSTRLAPGHRAPQPSPPTPDDDADEETYPLLGDHLDLEPLARDAVLLALPLAPLCREDCAGLCPTCGAERAGGACGCDPAPVDPRWAALDVLRAEGGAALPADGE
jgi:uncharacterized protein